MNKTYIISDYTPKMKGFISDLNISETNIISNEDFKDERECHDWTTKTLKNNDIEKIIIPLSLPTDAPVINTDGLLIALHIRLNYEIKISKRLIPIIFLSNFSVSNIIKKNSFDADNNPQNLIFTRSIYFSSFDLDHIKTTINIAKPCKPEEYNKDILNKLNILRKDIIGGHDIANAWGCFKLAQVVGVSDKIFKLDSISKHLKQLYAKYLICSNETFKTERRIDLEPIKCAGMKILFIDDKSDEGWSDLMKNIFKGAGDNFVFVDSAKYKTTGEPKYFRDFDGFINECRSHIGKDWDLIIIDLRLNPEKEDIDNEMISPTEFSGYKLIDEFLNKNEGYQIIVSTASNKIWNINAALERGASSYYVKESPEFNYSISETNKHYANFKNDVQICFDNAYLKDVFARSMKCKSHLNDLKKKKELDKDFVGGIVTFLDLAFESFKFKKGNYQFDSSFLYYFLILEATSKQFIDEDNSIATGDKFVFKFRKNNRKLKFFDKENQNKTSKDYMTKERRIAYNQKFYNLVDYANITDINPVKIVELRNSFNHPDLINNRKIASVLKENVLNIFNVIEKLILNLN